MNRNYLLFAALVLAVGVALADNVPEVEPVAGSAAEQAPPKDAPEQAAGETAEPEPPKDAPDQAAGDATDPEPTDEGADPEGDEQAKADEGPKEISGMSILGNREAPKSLVIVPWKSSVLGDTVGIMTMLDDSRQPVDKEEFMRALSYYEIRSEGTP